MPQKQTEQEQFWRGEFGNSYARRNRVSVGLAGVTNFWHRVMPTMPDVTSIIEFGANVGLNMRALQQLLPNAELSAVEINESAYTELQEIPGLTTYHQSLFDFTVDYPRDLAFTKGVLIHLNPDKLPDAYDLLYSASRRYIFLAEYYNPVPMAVPYRGHEGKLFKRDFAGEMLERYPDLTLVEYGFTYHRDQRYVEDDTTWFVPTKDGRHSN